MPKYLLATIVFLFGAILLIPLSAEAAHDTVTFNAATDIYLWGIPLTVTISSGGEVAEMEVNSNTINFDMENSSTVTLTSTDRKKFTNNLGIATVCADGTSYITLSSSVTQSISVTIGETCPTGAAVVSGGGAGPAADTIPPSISGVGALATETGATITWQTSESSLTWLVYGTTTAYGLEEKSTTYKTSHSVSLTGLTAGTTYHYKAKSKDSTGNEGSYSDKTFTTSGVTPVEVVEVVEVVAETVAGEATVTVAEGGSVEATTDEGATAKIELPANAVTAGATITVTPTQTTAAAVATQVAAAPAGKSVVGGYVYDCAVTVAEETVTTFEQAVTVTLTYTDTQVAGLDEDTLTINYYDTTLSQWVALTTTVDKENNTVTAETGHFTLFAILGEAEEVVEEEVVEEEVVTPIAEMTIAELKAEIARIAVLIADLQAELLKLLAAEGVPGAIEGVPSGFTFARNLKLEMSSNEVQYLQIVLNSDPATAVASAGAGAPGHETFYFGSLTKAAVIKFQEKYASEVLTPWNFTKGTGFVGSTTRAKLNALLGQ